MSKKGVHTQTSTKVSLLQAKTYRRGGEGRECYGLDCFEVFTPIASYFDENENKIIKLLNFQKCKKMVRRHGGQKNWLSAEIFVKLPNSLWGWHILQTDGCPCWHQLCWDSQAEVIINMWCSLWLPVDSVFCVKNPCQMLLLLQCQILKKLMYHISW